VLAWIFRPQRSRHCGVRAATSLNEAAACGRLAASLNARHARARGEAMDVAWRIQVSPAERAAASLEPGTLAQAALSLRTNGCVLLEPSLATPDRCAIACATAEQQIRYLLQRAERTFPGLDPLRDRILSAQVCNRSENGRRFDVHLDPRTCASPWSELLGEMRAWTRPLLEASGILGDDAGAGRVYTAGCVTSLAGGVAQGFHRDGDTVGCANVFAALVDVTPDNGPTELIIGSHLLSPQHAAEVAGLSEDSAEFAARAHVVQACAGMGSLLLFDFRTLHRGARHPPTAAGAEGLDAPSRPILYSVAARPGIETWDFFDHQPLANLPSGAGDDNVR
jgi:hypothetical protein